MSKLSEALAQPEGQPELTFKALENEVNQVIGIKLFTLMEIDYQKGVAWRNYSNMPESYPVSGEKPLQDNAWSETVEKRHQMFVANSIDEIAQVFGDYELIQSLGCESCLNIPIVIMGKLRGTLNCLHVAGHYTPARVSAAETLKQSGALAFLLAATVRG